MSKAQLRTLVTSILIIFGIILILLLVFVYRQIFLFMYGDKINNFQVSSSFRSLPGVKILSISTDDDGFSDLTLNVKNKGDMKISAFLPGYFNNPEHLFIRSIGPCTFQVYKYGYHNYDQMSASNGAMLKKGSLPYFSNSPYIDIGYKGAFAQLPGKTIHSVADAINSYDTMLNTVKTWPNSQKDIYKEFTYDTHTLDVVKGSPFVTHKEDYDLDFKYFYTADCTSKKKK